ncbi:carboxymuconolactone decarboxylase family protein [Kribbella kalugense]|uniref:carboxymuconolactone decarboxylase family protein n=1 Tax=Kribbella kalugense TaxID=2512221 RepID=UPI001065D608|nr:carboxymuconolactone decarboxylase family protein [Kribbella kalugense]
MIARGRDEELAIHIQAARRNDVTVDEIKETPAQAAIYCGVPAPHMGFIAQPFNPPLDSSTLALDGRGSCQGLPDESSRIALTISATRERSAGVRIS